MCQTSGWRDAVWTRTSTSRAPTAGVSMSFSSRRSGEPYASWTIAFITLTVPYWSTGRGTFAARRFGVSTRCRFGHAAEGRRRGRGWRLRGYQLVLGQPIRPDRAEPPAATLFFTMYQGKLYSSSPPEWV